MYKAYPCFVALLAICGCADKSPQPLHPDPSTMEPPVLAIAFMEAECKAGDAEACDVVEALAMAMTLCESDDDDGCAGLVQILDAMRDLDATLAREKCLDPCSEQCVNGCASSADGATDDCLDTCMKSCLDAGC